jgi:predicted metalloprotease with PDZ domain
MIEYELKISNPGSHLVDIAVVVRDFQTDKLDLILPSWSPGSYLIRDYAKSVVKTEACDEKGRVLECRKMAKNIWRLEGLKSNYCRFVYQVYCYEIGTSSSLVDDQHASLHGPSLFVYPVGMEESPCQLSLKFPSTWTEVSTGLEPVPGAEQIFKTESYHQLLDCPIEIGNHQVLNFEVQGVPHSIALYGKGNVDVEKLKKDVQSIVRQELLVFDHIPYKHYTFIIQLLSRRGGGLEHQNSTLIQVSRWKFSPEEEYRKTLSLIAHEFFHLWNVKRLAPKPLVHFDYTKENYTDLLWAAEGITSYYQDLLLLRCGLYTPAQYFETIMDFYKEYLQSPGRGVQSLCESSFDAWIKFYKLRLEESFRNLTISYYNKGALIGLALDLLLRHSTGNRITLDQALRELYHQTYLSSFTGYTLQDFKNVCENLSGKSFEDFFADHIQGRKELNLGEYLNLAGLKLVPKNDKTLGSGYLGVELRKNENQAVITSVSWNTPAFAAGISPGDEIVAWDGHRVFAHTLPERIKEAKPGSEHHVSLFRDEEWREVKVSVGEKPAEWRICRVENPGTEAVDLLKSWIGTTELNEEKKHPDTVAAVQ